MDPKEKGPWNVRDVPAEARHQFKAMCYEQGLNMGEVIGKLMLEYVAKSKKKAKA